MHGLVALHLCAYKSSAQTFELIVDLFTPGLERTRERWIDRLEILPQTIELVIDVLFSIREQLRRVGAEMLLDNALDDRFESFKKVLQAQPISLQRATRVTLDHRQTRARQDRCRWSFEHAVDFSGLREVCDLRSAAVVSNRRQQIILNHSAQRDVWTEPLRLFLRQGRKLFGGVFLLVILRFVLSAFNSRDRVSRALLVV